MASVMLGTVPGQQCPKSKNWKLRIFYRNVHRFFVSNYKCTCNVYFSPSTSMSLFKNSTPIVWKLFSSNWFETKRFIRQLLPTPPSPRMTTFNRVVRFGGRIDVMAFIALCVVWYALKRFIIFSRVVWFSIYFERTSANKHTAHFYLRRRVINAGDVFVNYSTI